MKIKKLLFFLCTVSLVMSMLAPAASAVDLVGDWTIEIQKIDIVDRLETTQILTNYDGSTYEQVFTNEPAEGFCFAVVMLGVTRQSASASAFPINEVQLNVSEGGAFVCNTNNNFLKNHNYDIFESTSLLVSDIGALCFEIPESYLGDNGDGWYVSYETLESAPYFADSIQEVPYAQNDVDVQEEYEAAVLREYQEAGPLSLQEAMIVQDLYGNAPLTAIALFDTDTPCDVTVTVHGKTSEADITYSVGDVVTQHQVPIFGLYAGMENKVTITAGQESWDHYITTDPIPDSVSMQILADESNDITQIADGQLYMLQEIYHTIFDVNGDIRWYLGEKYTTNVSIDYSNAFSLSPEKDGLWISYNPCTGWVYNKSLF